MKTRLVASILTVTFFAVCVVATDPAAAHSTVGVPYHTKPEPGGWARYYGGDCEYRFTNPSVVLGYTSEYVYWQPIAAAYISGRWQYKYGEWRRAWVSSTAMLFGWESRQWPSYDWAFANGYSTVLVSPGTSWYVGYQIYYSSKGKYHHEWTSIEPC